MPDTVIRACEPSDWVRLRALYSEPSTYADTLQLPYSTEADWRERMAPRPGFHSLVAVRHDEVVGQLSLQVSQAARRRHAATLGMGVKQSVRRTGVGTALLRAAIDLGERWLNVCRFEIEVYTDNHGAVALYERHGFQLDGTCRGYAFRDGRLVDAYIMARLSSIVPR